MEVVEVLSELEEGVMQMREGEEAKITVPVRPLTLL